MPQGNLQVDFLQEILCGWDPILYVKTLLSMVQSIVWLLKLIYWFLAW